MYIYIYIYLYTPTSSVHEFTKKRCCGKCPCGVDGAYNEHNGWEMGMDGMEHVPQSRTLKSGMYDI